MFVLIGIFNDGKIAVQISTMPESFLPRSCEVTKVVASVTQTNEIWWANVAAFDW